MNKAAYLRGFKQLYSEDIDPIPLLAVDSDTVARQVRTSPSSTRTSHPVVNNATAPAVLRHDAPSYSSRQTVVAVPQRRSARNSTVSNPRNSRRGTTTGGRGSGFSLQELESLLETLESHLPLGQEEWDYVTSLHHSRYPQERRTTDSLKRKFSALYRKRIPTGDPMIPNEVKWAKKVRGMMTERADIGSGGDVNELPEIEHEEVADYDLNDIDIADNEEIISEPTASERNGNPASITPRALVSRRTRQDPKGDELLEILKLQMLQDRERREEERVRREEERGDERKRREEERIRREEDRAEERARRQEDRKSNESFMKMMLILMAKESKSRDRSFDNTSDEDRT